MPFITLVPPVGAVVTPLMLYVVVEAPDATRTLSPTNKLWLSKYVVDSASLFTDSI
jgi:hypothetical protein